MYFHNFRIALMHGMSVRVETSSSGSTCTFTILEFLLNMECLRVEGGSVAAYVFSKFWNFYCNWNVCKNRRWLKWQYMYFHNFRISLTHGMFVREEASSSGNIFTVLEFLLHMECLKRLRGIQ